MSQNVITIEKTNPVKRIVSGLQPTGALHLGNYLGAMRSWVDLTKVAEKAFFFVADLHALTEVVPADTRARNIDNMLLMIDACGIDTSKAFVFRQSDLMYHTELAWYLMCTARTGWLNRMVQYKDKGGNDVEAAFRAGCAAGLGMLGSPDSWMDQQWAQYDQNRSSVSAGLYTYPVLQAADILLYDATHVPVGEDQFQHLQLTRDIAQSFNSSYGETFRLPEALITPVGGRVMSLYDASKKMSKSDPNVEHRIELLDVPDAIKRKIKRATSDSFMLPETIEELANRKEALNLITIYSAMESISPQEGLSRFSGSGFGKLKGELTDVLVHHLEPIRTRYYEMAEDRAAHVARINRSDCIMTDAEDVLIRVRAALYGK
jgi:tryptophanyl-tRNA synthetase